MPSGRFWVARFAPQLRAGGPCMQSARWGCTYAAGIPEMGCTQLRVRKVGDHEPFWSERSKKHAMCAAPHLCSAAQSSASEWRPKGDRLRRMVPVNSTGTCTYVKPGWVHIQPLRQVRHRRCDFSAEGGHGQHAGSLLTYRQPDGRQRSSVYKPSCAA